ENKADHQGLRRALFCMRAPHERALILTIRKPIARPARAFSVSCCIAVARKATVFLRGGQACCCIFTLAVVRGTPHHAAKSSKAAGKRRLPVRPEAAQGGPRRFRPTARRTQEAGPHRAPPDRSPDAPPRPARREGGGCRGREVRSIPQ